MPAARDGSRTKRPVDIAQLRLIAKVARMYHEGGVRQPQIAAELSLSQARVSRLLRQASEIGVVRTVVTLPPGVYTDLEEQLQEKFNLRDAVIVDVDGARGQVVPALGAATAQYLNSTLTGGEVLGVSSWSATLLAAAEVMPARSTSPLDRVVQIVGGHGDPSVQVQANRLTGELAAVTGARPVFLPAPGLVSSPALRRALVKDASIGDVMKSWKELDLALVGIGSLEPSPLLRQSGNALTEAEQDQLRNAGAVGDVCLRFFDVNGVTVKTSLDERVMSITPADLMQVPRRVGVAGGASKGKAIQAALRGAWVNVLVTDLDTARALVEDTEARPADLLSAEGLGASCFRLWSLLRSPQAQPRPGGRKRYVMRFVTVRIDGKSGPSGPMTTRWRTAAASLRETA